MERALLSVEDKDHLGEFAAGLSALGVELWATAGTRRAVTAAGGSARAVEELTGVDAWFGGRLKTLHPAVFGGILAPRTSEGLGELAERQLRRFDLVVVNFYPFERHLADQPEATDREEFIDIGGVALARAAAKNHAAVAVASDPSQYAAILAELQQRGGRLSDATRRHLAVEAFARCSRYDAAIASGLRPRSSPPPGFPAEVLLRADPLVLRYGENPHQRAQAYAFAGPAPLDQPATPLEVLKGAAPSYTNLLDLETAIGLVAEFDRPAAAVVKHATPCGAAAAGDVRTALAEAIATDPVARYGCVVAVNRPLGGDDLEALRGVFVDLLWAPELAPGAIDVLGRRAKIKLVRGALDPRYRPAWEARTALGRLLVQEADRRPLDLSSLRHVAGPPLPPADLPSLGFAWSVVRHARSNAIALVQGTSTVGIGSGQPTRVKAVELACEVAGARARGSVLASDAFFPFADGIEVAARAGVRATVQPGGSVRDADVLAAAQRAGMSMYLTGWRVFRH